MKVSYNLLPDYVNVARNIAETLTSRNWRMGEYEPVNLTEEYEKMKKMTVKERLEYVSKQMN